MQGEGISPAGVAASGESLALQVRRTLLEEPRSIKGSQLQAALAQSHAAMEKGHKALTSAWGTPLSLFDSAAEAVAVRRGVPLLALAAVRHGRALVEEATALGDRTDAYEAQIAIAAREGRGLKRDALLAHFDALDVMGRRLAGHLQAMQDARVAFTSTPPAAVRPSAAAAALARAIFDQGGLAEPQHQPQAHLPQEASPPPVSRQPLEPEILRQLEELQEKFQREDVRSDEVDVAQTTILEPAKPMTKAEAKMRSMWRSMRQTSLEYGPAALEFAIDAVVAATGQLVPKAEPSSPSRSAARRPWEETRGRPSSWLAVEEQPRASWQPAVRGTVYDDDPSVADAISAKSRWDRCRRRDDRRWSIP